MTGLLPCPFCGESRAMICATHFEGEDREAFAVSCRTRDCHGVIFTLGYGLFETREKAAEAWNTRTDDAAQGAPDPENILTLTPEAHAAFIDACENPAPPTQALIDLMRDYGTKAPAQAVPAPVAWRLTDGEGDYEYLTEEPSDQSRAWSRRYGREWEPLYASPVSSTPSEAAKAAPDREQLIECISRFDVFSTAAQVADAILALSVTPSEPAQAVPAPVAWRLTDGEGDYEYLTEEPLDQSRAWSRRYGREWEPLYASPVSSTPSEAAKAAPDREQLIECISRLCCPAGCMFTPCRSSQHSSTSRDTL